jgi:hypothetical protein
LSGKAAQINHDDFYPEFTFFTVRRLYDRPARDQARQRVRALFA